MKVAILGCGTIGKALCDLIPANIGSTIVAAVIARHENHSSLRRILPSGVLLAKSVSEICGLGIDLVIECAGHAALKDFGVEILRSELDLLVVSVGALAEPKIESSLRSAAADTGRKIRIPTGAFGGLDVLGAAKHAGLAYVLYRGRKLPAAWRSTPAEQMVSLNAITQPTTFFEGNAREAAQLFPQNANVAAAVALAGLGFENTRVKLIADPTAIGNTHYVEGSGTFGEMSFRITGKPLASNPKTSMLAPYSVIRSLVNLTETLVIS